MVPAIAAAASWMETMKMPLRELYKKYRSSELAMMGWRSGEVSSNMHVQRGSSANESAGNAPVQASSTYEQSIEDNLGPEIVAKLNKYDMDMRKLTGDEFVRFATTFKINLGWSQRTLAPASDDEIKMKEAYRNG